MSPIFAKRNASPGSAVRLLPDSIVHSPIVFSGKDINEQDVSKDYVVGDQNDVVKDVATIPIARLEMSAYTEDIGVCETDESQILELSNDSLQIIDWWGFERNVVCFPNVVEKASKNTRVWQSDYDRPPYIPCMFFYDTFSIVSYNYGKVKARSFITLYYYVPPTTPVAKYRSILEIDQLEGEWMLLYGIWISQCGVLFMLFKTNASSEFVLKNVGTINPFKKCVVLHT